eukprot:CAMPEP_0114467198 /NCGR_PEP_ID=MMETSP0104-20121206/9487_1 /TAXON_ID=37642 ORGANISM="Paraphysomonas imperforata, Strain PA2" /NCGR_SAMPLE_ID=MMETSP0104 /ASSEMBLY_ACC=CAM_ASM_000202 /LENGTH=892 /DNA_ID=CAMNT_0001640633 /DNA_START=30 /DNA_END=2709 /DNA_ORIENTATION=-
MTKLKATVSSQREATSSKSQALASSEAVSTLGEDLQRSKEALEQTSRKVEVLEGRVAELSSTQQVVLTSFSQQQQQQQQQQQHQLGSSQEQHLRGVHVMEKKHASSAVAEHQLLFDEAKAAQERKLREQKLRDLYGKDDEDVEDDATDVLTTAVVDTSILEADKSNVSAKPQESAKESTSQGDSQSNSDFSSDDNDDEDEGSDHDDDFNKDKDEDGDGDIIGVKDFDDGDEQDSDSDNSFDNESDEPLGDRRGQLSVVKESPMKNNFKSNLDNSFEDNIPFLSDSAPTSMNSPQQLESRAPLVKESAGDEDIASSSEDDTSTVEEDSAPAAQKQTTTSPSPRDEDLEDNSFDEDSDEDSDGGGDNESVPTSMTNQLKKTEHDVNLESSFEDDIPSLPSSSKSSPVKQQQAPQPTSTTVTDDVQSFDMDISVEGGLSGFSSPGKHSSLKMSPSRGQQDHLQSEVDHDQGDEDEDANNIVSFTSLGASFVDSDTINEKSPREEQAGGEGLSDSEEPDHSVDDYIKAMSFGSTSDIITAQEDVRVPSSDSQNSSGHADSSASSISFDLAAEKRLREGGGSSVEQQDDSRSLERVDEHKTEGGVDDDDDWDRESESEDETDEGQGGSKIDEEALQLEKARAMVQSKNSNIFGFSALEDSVDLSRSGSDDEKSEKPSTSVVATFEKKALDDSDSESDGDGDKSENVAAASTAKSQPTPEPSAKISFREKLRLRQEALKLEKSLAAASSPSKQQATGQETSSPASSVSSASSSSPDSSPEQLPKRSLAKQEQEEVDQGDEVGTFSPVPSPEKKQTVASAGATTSSGTSIMREKLAKYGVSNFSSDEDDDDDDAHEEKSSERTATGTAGLSEDGVKDDSRQNESDDMVMSFDNSFDDSF